jgi:hypothetical protein
MRRHVFDIVVSIICLCMTGCGGCGVSEAQLRQAAQRQRPPEAPEPADEKPSNADAAKDQAEPEHSISSGAKGPVSPIGPESPKVSSVSNEKPSQPLTEAERRARSIVNLEKIGRALMAYAKKKNGKLPPQATSKDGEALLSWRVQILPELGYPELRSRFKHEAWDSSHNKLLLDYIPPEYQSPERFDVKTNYLAVTGRGTVFPDLEGVYLNEIKDGAENSLAVVEVDDKYALEWTRPADHVPAFDLPTDKLGGLRGEGSFALLASGRVVLLAKDMPPSRLAALFTATGGEPVGAASFLKVPTPDPPPATLVTLADDPSAANQPASETEGAATAETIATGPPTFPGATPDVSSAGKEEVPGEEALAKARDLLRELYGKDFQRAKSPDEQRQFLKKLLDNAVNVEQNPADFHELIRIVRDMSASLGDVTQALSACELLEQRFQVDALSMRLAVLESVSSRAGELTSPDSALKEAERLWREAFEADCYDVALPACEAALNFARMTGIRTEVTRLHQQVNSLEAAKSLHLAAQRAFDALQVNSGDAAAQEAVGRYVCLVKNRWEAGLPYLSKAADIRLRGIASIELAPDRSAEETFSLAEQYWDLAGRFKPPQRRGLHLRAVYCYGQVGPKLASSLEKIKAQRRIDEAAGLYGREEIGRVLAPLMPDERPAVSSAN